MSGYITIIVSILMLATNAAWGRDRTAALTGVDQAVVHGTPATWVARNGIDQKALNPMLTSATPSAGVILTAGRGGGMMHGSVSGRSNWGHSFQSRPFGSQSFDRNHSFHRDFDRDRFIHRDFHRDHFVHRNRFFDRDDFFAFRFGFYPYANYYYYPYYYYPYGYYYGYPGYFYPYFYFSW
jgi:hypothetical protein